MKLAGGPFLTSSSIRQVSWGARLLGRTVRGIIKGDAVPAEFVPQLIEYHLSGRLPFERLVWRNDPTSIALFVLPRIGAPLSLDTCPVRCLARSLLVFSLTLVFDPHEYEVGDGAAF